MQKVRELIEKFSEPRDVLIDLPPILKVAESIRLLDLLDRTGSLKDLSRESKDIKKFCAAGLAVFFHVLPMKAALIKASLKQEHEARPDVASNDYETFCNELARKYLGETRPYDQLK